MNLVSQRASTRQIREAALAKGFRPLAVDGVRRILQGVTSLAEVSRVVDLIRPGKLTSWPCIPTAPSTARGNPAKACRMPRTEVDLELRLKRGGLDLVDARVDEGKAGLRRSKIRRPELITFFFNLEQLTRAGVPLLESLADLRDTMNDPRFREIIAGLVESIEGGKNLSQAMAQHPDAFDKIFVSLAPCRRGKRTIAGNFPAHHRIAQVAG